MKDVRNHTGLLRTWEIGALQPRSFSQKIGACQDLIKRLERYAELDGHAGCVNTVHFNSSGGILVSGSDDMNIVFWDWAARTEKLCFSSGHDHNVFQAKTMHFSDDKSIVSCAADGQVRHAVIADNGDVYTKMLARHEGRAHKLAIEPGSPRTFFSCGEDGDVRHFDLRENGNTKIASCRGLRNSRKGTVIHLNAIVINSRNPNYFAVGGSDEFARVYDLRKVTTSGGGGGGSRGGGGGDSPVDVFVPAHLIGNTQQLHITCVAYSQQEELLVSYNDEHIYLFDKGGGLGPSPPSGAASRAASTESSNAAAADSKGEEAADKQDGREKRGYEVYKGHRNAQTVKGVNFFGPKCEYVVSGSDCGNIFIWKKRGAELVAMMHGDQQVVNCVEPNPIVTVLATSGMDSTVKLWAPTAKEAKPLPNDAHEIMESNKLNREDKLSVPDVFMSLLHATHLRDFDHFRRVRRRPSRP